MHEEGRCDDAWKCDAGQNDEKGHGDGGHGDVGAADTNARRDCGRICGGWDGKGQHVEKGRAETDRTRLQRQAYTATDGNLPLRRAALHTAGPTGAVADPSRFSCSRT